MLNIFKQKLALINNVYIQDEIISEDSQTKNAFWAAFSPWEKHRKNNPISFSQSLFYKARKH